ncbi:conserved protein, unknown function [Hepatocystis sp. ex Piliocolobus tephrosceles]|nr:conserved protein, unknown function [Hepatocystis sp. ex Piliocolobus tephrosceles]
MEKSRDVLVKTIRNFIRTVNIEKGSLLDNEALNELKLWGKKNFLNNYGVLDGYINYKQVLNDYINIMRENNKESKAPNIENVANYVGLTTNYSKEKGVSKK